MSMTSNPAEFARQLHRALRERQAIDMPAADALGLDAAYAVQHELLALREATGEQLVGMKVAFTNPKMMQRLGVQEPATGHLTDAMRVLAGGTAVLDCERPRAEAEMAFLLSADIGEEDAALWQADPARLIEKVAAIAPAIELVGSRYRDAGFVLGAIVADNASAHAFVVGTWTAVQPGDDLAAKAIVFTRNGQETARGTASAILGHPLNSLAAAARMGLAQGRPLKRGFVVMAGSAIDPVPVEPGDELSVCMDGAGCVDVTLAAS